MSRFVTDGLRTKIGGPFSFSVEEGECVALSGPSGCGKTLLLRALADLDPSEGTVFLDDVNRNTIAAPEWRRRVGWLPAESAWWANCVGEHFPTFGKRDALAPRSAVPQRSCLEKLGFGEDVLDWRIERLSTGEKQRLALFRLLLNEPQVLLLDEPTASLDVSNVWKAEEVIGEYRRSTGAAVIWVSHDPEQAARVADRRMKFVNGGLEAVQ